MAYTQGDFVKDLAAYSAGATIGVTRTRKMLGYAAKKGIQLGAVVGGRAAVPAARVAVATPVGRAATAAALGYGAYQAGAFGDPMARIEELERRLDQPIAEPIPLPEPFLKARKRVTSKFNRAVKAGMAAVKTSTSNGKKGAIKTPAKALAQVSKVVSGIKKKRKAPKSGIRRKIYLAAKKYI